MSSQTWIEWFTSQPFGKYFVKIDPSYLNEEFNFYGLRQQVSHFNQALEIIRGPIPNLKKKCSSEQNEAAMILYGLIHARYILTEAGLEKMHEKYLHHDFEKCPRVLCDGMQCLPYGSLNTCGQSNVKMFCPNCYDVYLISNPETVCIDGAFFGSTWVHSFLEKYSDIVPKVPAQQYVPRIFGFRLYGDGVEDSSSDSEGDE